MPASNRLDDETIKRILKNPSQSDPNSDMFIKTDVLIAGTGPIGATYARKILDAKPGTQVIMADVGSQDSPVIGTHHKNAIKYQKDLDLFVHVISAALQLISVVPEDSHIQDLGGAAWRTDAHQTLVFKGRNPNQKARFNLEASAVTRAVGGMATHWNCCCPIPHEDERQENPIDEFNELLGDAGDLLNVSTTEYDNSIRHIVVKETLEKHFPSGVVQNLPLGVKRREDNPSFVKWTGVDTILGEHVTMKNITLLAEHLVTKVFQDPDNPQRIACACLRDLKHDRDVLVQAKAIVLCCGAVGTPQVLFNSDFSHKLPALGHYLSEQSVAFCQIVLKKDIVDSIRKDKRFEDAVKQHESRYPSDPLPIPFFDPEPQVMFPYSSERPWHVVIHRDASSYGDIGQRADPRVVLDLRWFGKQDVKESNCVHFHQIQEQYDQWVPGVTDLYGMPQPTFYVEASQQDNDRNQLMMEEMTVVASKLGSYLPGSTPQLLAPGTVLHVTGTTRIGKDDAKSVANEHSIVHGFSNLWVGGNGCIPDSTACNPTRTSVAIAIKGAQAVVEYLNSEQQD